MTTQDQHIDAGQPTELLDSTPPTAKCAPNVPAEHAAAQRDPIEQDRIEQDRVAASEPSSSDKALFPADDLSGLRARWDDVQAGFVDDPKACVQKADGLVSDVVEQLTTNFAAARARLEEQWARGDDASTEDLRIALKRYREFFQKLLAV